MLSVPPTLKSHKFNRQIALHQTKTPCLSFKAAPQAVVNTDLKEIPDLKSYFSPFCSIRDIHFNLLTNTQKTFDDLAGLGKPKKSLKEILNTLTSTEKKTNDFCTTCLLQGNTGTGKTALIESLATELQKKKIPVISISGGDFGIDQTREAKGDYAGSGAARVDNLFWFAEKKADLNPYQAAVIVIDNIDGMLPVRNSANKDPLTINAEEVLAKFVSKVDQLRHDPNHKIVVIGTTSNAVSIDLEAFNTFENVINVNAPTTYTENSLLINKLLDQKGYNIETTNKKEFIDRVSLFTLGYTPKKMNQFLDIANKYATSNNRNIVLKDCLAAHIHLKDGITRPTFDDPYFQKVTIAHELSHVLGRIVMNRIADRLNAEHHIPHAYIGLVNCLNLDKKADGGYSACVEVMANPKNTVNSFDYNFGEMVSAVISDKTEKMFGLATNGPRNDYTYAYSLANKTVKDWGMSQLGYKISSNIDQESVMAKQIEQDTQKIINAACQAAEKVAVYYQDFIKDTANFLYNEKNKDKQPPKDPDYPDPNIYPAEDLKTMINAWDAQQPLEKRRSLEDELINILFDVRPIKQEEVISF